MVKIIWDNCRRADGTISLESAAKHTGCFISDEALAYLYAVEELHPITSRQAAAVAIGTALQLSSQK